MNAALSLFGGLGLFFIGISLLGEHLKPVSGRRLRSLVRKAVAGRFSTALFGLGIGVVLRSINAVIFVLSTLVSVGAMSARQAFPLIGWANLGTAAILLVVSVSINAWVLTLLGLTGIAYYLNIDQRPRYRNLLGALLGIGLLFLGLDLIREGAAHLKHAVWLRDHLSASGTSLLLSLFTGIGVTLLAQSSSTITIITMTVASAGLIELQSGIVIVLGAILGSGLSALLLGHNLTGSTRQLVIYQVILKLAGVGSMALLLALELLGGIPLLLAECRHYALSPAASLAAVYVTTQVLSDLVVHLFHHRVERLVVRYSPPSAVEAYGVPHFLNEQALVEPHSALELVVCEQRQLLADLPMFLDQIREDCPTPSMEIEVLFGGGKRIAAECDAFLTTIADRHRSSEVLEATIMLRQRNELIFSLQETLQEFYRAVSAARQEKECRQLVTNLTESLHMMIFALADAAADQGDDLELLHRLTHDRTVQMEDIRRQWLRASTTVDVPIQQAVFSATTVFERAVWLMRRFVLLLAPEHTAPAYGSAHHRT